MRGNMERCLAWVFRQLKPYFLEYAYTRPDLLEVYYGNEECYSIMKQLVYHSQLNIVAVCTGDDRDLSAPVVWVDGARYGTYGWQSTCRYIGRHSRLYPTTPENALILDASLDALSDLMCSVRSLADHSDKKKCIYKELVSLEDRTGPWVELDALNLADVCWFGVLKWYDTKGLVDLSDFPSLSTWYETMQAF
jgi:hypothetical protein